MKKRLIRWGNISLLIAVACLAVFCYRNDAHDAGFDQINIWLFSGIVIGLLTGMTLKSIVMFKKIKEDDQQEAQIEQ